jgi:hypothetical protein
MKTKKKELYAYLIGAGAILSLVTVVLGASQKAMTTNYNFSTPLIIVMVAAIVIGIMNFFLNFDFLPLVASVLFSVSFGMIFDQGLPVVVDKLNNITFQGGKFEQVALYMILMLTACILSFIACFIKKKD